MPYGEIDLQQSRQPEPSLRQLPQLIFSASSSNSSTLKLPSP